MDLSPYLAHITEDGRTQTIFSHLQGTASLAQIFARVFHAEEQAKLVGLAHDIGKYSSSFQKRLNGSNIRVDHSTAGAVECWRMRQPFAAFAVAGHHGGLPNGGNRTDGPEQTTLLGRLRRENCGELEQYSRWTDEVSLPRAAFPDFMMNQGAFEAVFFTRMLYSCLVDADFLDTEAFMKGYSREHKEASIEQLCDKLRGYISGWFPPKNDLNRQRCHILQRCIDEGNQQHPGLFSLTVPTGGGKTVASLAFALNHAKKHGLNRVIYVIPYTSIIEQTAEAFRNILGSENVLEHHSNILYDLEEEATSFTMRLAHATENWDMPVVVTTAVQFFESLYACRSSQCRKIHNIAGSVVIFDEAQMMPIPYLRPCLYAVSELVKHYGVSAVLCTATQPAFESIFREFLPDRPMIELCRPGTFQSDIFRRVTFQHKGVYSWDQLAEQLNQNRQVLCVVNTRKAAQEVYHYLDGTGSFHLSTLMCPYHRKKQLSEIRRRLKEGLPCRVVSTSLIEAGVDVDFPTVFREQAGLDSILQAAGRCNREGKRASEDSVVIVFSGEDSVSPLYSTVVGAAKEVMERYEDLSSEEAIHFYFQQLLQLKGERAQDVQTILSLIETEFFPFRTVAERFHLIDTPTRTIYVPTGDGLELVEQLRMTGGSQRLFRLLGQYGVSVYEQHFDALNRAGDLEMLENGAAILKNMMLYSDETGLSLEADFGKGLFI